jgi:hypothetical protein
MTVRATGTRTHRVDTHHSCRCTTSLLTRYVIMASRVPDKAMVHMMVDRYRVDWA